MSYIKILFLVGFILAYFFNVDTLIAQENWEQTRKEDGVRIFERDGGNRLNDIKLEYSVESNVNGVLNFLLNKKGYHALVDNIEDVRFIKKVNDTVRYYFINISVDPFIDRDAVVKVSFERISQKSIRSEMVLDNSIGYEIENTSVMPFRIEWLFTPVSEQMINVELVYSAKVDDYNDFVYDIIEELLKEQLFGMTKKMQESIADSTYQNTDHNLW